eukprot:1553610-Amphidinium_carterae.1
MRRCRKHQGKDDGMFHLVVFLFARFRGRVKIVLPGNITGDILVLPEFTAYQSGSNQTFSFDYGDVAVRHDFNNSLPWVADSLRSYAWLQQLNNISSE